jgi:hypothetical protein
MKKNEDCCNGQQEDPRSEQGEDGTAARFLGLHRYTLLAQHSQEVPVREYVGREVLD